MAEIIVNSPTRCVDRLQSIVQRNIGNSEHVSETINDFLDYRVHRILLRNPAVIDELNCGITFAEKSVG